ncbi:MAG: segregation/condensation protein A [Candidatus Hydrothermarchaeaceae archaeon]
MHPVELLIDLVISEERDPWDIDIADIANNFLAKVREMATLNLRLSGKTLLAASILLRMKSDTLMPEEDDGEVWDGFIEDGIFQAAPMDGMGSKEEAPSFVVPPRRRDERKTTLFELIEALQRALSEEMIRKNFPRETRRRTMVIKVDEEGLKERIAKVYERIKELAELNEVVRFSELLNGRSRRSIVEVVLPLLYLASDGRIVIWQKELFGEIFITLGG